MRLALTIVAADGAELPAGSAVSVQLRDTSFEDAPARVLDEWAQTVPEHAQSLPLQVEIADDLIDAGDATWWVHVDSDGDGRLGRGDYVTMQAYPLRSGDAALTLQVKKID